MIRSLRELLYDDPAGSGQILSSLVGRVMLEQIWGEGKKRPQWHTLFSLGVSKVMVETARNANGPSTDTWEFLSHRSWTTGQATTVAIRSFSNAKRLAKSAEEMIEAGGGRQYGGNGPRVGC